MPRFRDNRTVPKPGYRFVAPLAPGANAIGSVEQGKVIAPRGTVGIGLTHGLGAAVQTHA
jgi:hypothetical protein